MLIIPAGWLSECSLYEFHFQERDPRNRCNLMLDWVIEMFHRSITNLLIMPGHRSYSSEWVTAAADVSKARLPHRRNVKKLSGRLALTQLWHTSKLYRENEKNWQTDSWLGGNLEQGPLTWPQKGEKKASTAVHACMSAQPKSGSLPYRIICPPSRYRKRVTLWLGINVEGERWKLENVQGSMTKWGKLQHQGECVWVQRGKWKWCAPPPFWSTLLK